MSKNLIIVEKLFRIIVELSPMNNNDEYNFCSPVELEGEFKEKILKIFRKGYNDPIIVLQRPVYQIELDQGFKPLSTVISCFDEEIPEITRQIDALYKIKKHIGFAKKRDNFNPSKFIAFYLGTFFYDCMSGGMPKWELALMKLFAEQNIINKNEQVYPNGPNEDWITIADFLKEMKNMNVPKLENNCQTLALEIL